MLQPVRKTVADYLAYDGERVELIDGEFLVTAAPSPRRGVNPAMRSLAVVLYAFAGASMGKIARLCGVSTVAVLKWVRAAGLAVGLPDPAAASDIVLIDEMWHFVNGKKTRFGSGGPWTAYRVRLSDGNSALVAMPSRNG